jgi:MFS family permease
VTRDLRLFYLFRLLATSYLYVPIFMLFQEQRGLSFFERLLLGGLYSVVAIVVEIPTGVLADRIGRRRSMMAGAALMIASSLIAYRAHGVATFAVAEVLAALSLALCSGADSAYLYDLLSTRGAAHEYGRRESVASAWHLAGSAIAFAGGGALATIDLALPYVATAVVATAALGVASLLRDDRPAPGVHRPAPPRYGAAIRTALATARRSPRLLWLVGYSAVVFTLLRATIYLYQPYLKAQGLGTAQIGLVFAGVYLTASLVALRTPSWRRRVGDETLLWGLLATLALSFGAMAFVSGPGVLLLLGVQAVACGLYSPLTKPLLNEAIADSRHRAALLSTEGMARRATMGLFAPLAGLYGEGSVLQLCAALGAVGLVVLLVARPRARPARVAAARLREVG